MSLFESNITLSVSKLVGEGFFLWSHSPSHRRCEYNFLTSSFFLLCLGFKKFLSFVLTGSSIFWNSKWLGRRSRKSRNTGSQGARSARTEWFAGKRARYHQAAGGECLTATEDDWRPLGGRELCAQVRAHSNLKLADVSIFQTFYPILRDPRTVLRHYRTKTTYFSLVSMPYHTYVLFCWAILAARFSWVVGSGFCMGRYCIRSYDASYTTIHIIWKALRCYHLITEKHRMRILYCDWKRRGVELAARKELVAEGYDLAWTTVAWAKLQLKERTSGRVLISHKNTQRQKDPI